MLTKATHIDMHALIQKNERQVCSTDLPESPLDAVNGPTRRSSRTHESVRLIAGQDLGAAHVLSSIFSRGGNPCLQALARSRVNSISNKRFAE